MLAIIITISFFVFNKIEGFNLIFVTWHPVSPRFASTKSLFVLYLQLKAYPEGAIAVMATV